MLPHNLVLTYARCDYCEKEERYAALVYDNFGINTCTDHYELGKRDCKSYLYLNSMIHLQDVKQLVDALPQTFSIKRSSGEIQDGWSVNFDDPYFRRIEGEWYIPCMNKKYNLIKKSLIKDMNLSLLSELDSIMAAHSQDKPNLESHYVEHPAIQRVVVNGTECRMFIQDLA